MLIRDNYPNVVMSFNFMYSLNLLDMYVEINIIILYCFNAFLNSDKLNEDHCLHKVFLLLGK